MSQPLEALAGLHQPGGPGELMAAPVGTYYPHRTIILLGEPVDKAEKTGRLEQAVLFWALRGFGLSPLAAEAAEGMSSRSVL